MHPVSLVKFDFDCVAQAITGETFNLIIKRKFKRNFKSGGQKKGESKKPDGVGPIENRPSTN